MLIAEIVGVLVLVIYAVRLYRSVWDYGYMKGGSVPKYVPWLMGAIGLAGIFVTRPPFYRLATLLSGQQETTWWMRMIQVKIFFLPLLAIGAAKAMVWYEERQSSQSVPWWL